jgi:DeoR family suf operon transcriptional repressor
MKAPLTQSSKEYILQYLLKQEKATANEIAKALEISRQATRRHLNDLENEGLIAHDIIQPKIGRPQHEYYLCEKGRDRFPHRYGEFALSFLDTLTETVGPSQVSQLLQKQWERKAREYRQYIQGNNLEEKVKKLVEIRQKEGYMAELYYLDDHRPKSQKFFISEHNCAISEVAESYPQVCGHELEMFMALFPDCKVERTNWLNNGEHLCGYLIEAN